MALRKLKRDSLHREAGRDDEISKKNLLAQTGISYGQFYRWKRMGLIPEAWFRRRSTFTGQETFLPRQKVLKRIERIISMRDKASLEEIARTLSPDLTDRQYRSEEVAAMAWLSPRAIELLPAKRDGQPFSFLDVVCLSMAQRMLGGGVLGKVQIALAVEALLAGFSELDPASGRRLTVACGSGATTTVLHEGRCIFDSNMKVLETVNLDELIEEIKVALRDLVE